MAAGCRTFSRTENDVFNIATSLTISQSKAYIFFLGDFGFRLVSVKPVSSDQ
jgi:hypothetical protein